MNVVVIDIGGTNVKLWRTGESEKIKIPSGLSLGPKELVDEVRRWLGDQTVDRVSIGYPGEVVHGRPTKDPYNLAPGWIDFDFATAFACPVRLMNDACMQALGGYEGGRMFYLGLGTGVGTTFISDGKIVPLALGHMRLTRKATFDEALSRKGLKTFGVRLWTEAVRQAARDLKYAFLADYIMLGGGNAKKLTELPPDCRRGGNFHAYVGGLRMWEDGRHSQELPPDKSLVLRVNAGS